MDYIKTHAETIAKAVEAISTRGYFSAYPESVSPKIYGETAKADQEAAFKALLDKPFALPQAHDAGYIGAEHSPFGLKLGITYPAAQVETLVSAAEKAGEAWGKADPELRAAICVEIVNRINAQSFLMANAVMHTSGQAFGMAFQAGGPHAQDRALEAIAYGIAEMRRIPRDVTWEKPQGKADPLRLSKTFRIVPRGISLIIGCATFPTWNTYPALFASLVTGNSVIIKPHPASILPVALTLRLAQEVLVEAGFAPQLLQLAPDTADAPIAVKLAEHPAVKLVDFTGSSQFGSWLRHNIKDKDVFTEEAGLNSITIDSAPAFTAMCDNIAFSLSLYSGQMCTAPQNIFVPTGGIQTDEGHKSFDEVGAGIAAAIDRLLSDPVRAAGILGGIQNPASLSRIVEARKLGKIIRDSAPLDGTARTASPLLIAVSGTNEPAYEEERFGPIAFLIAVKDTKEGLARASKGVREKGAITAAFYSMNDAQIDAAEDVFAAAGVALSINLIGGIFVNQSAAFSDYHVTGANPAGNASLTDSAFVAKRFRVAPSRRLMAA